MPKNNLLRKLAIAVAPGLLCIFSTTSVAETVIDTLTIGQWEATQASNLLLEQQVQNARLQQQLRQAQSGESINPGTVAGSMPATPMIDVTAENAPSRGQSDRVRLQEIYGRSGELRARIFLPRGGSTEVHKGDLIPGTKLTVTAVTPDVVRLSDGSELTF